MQFSSVPMSVIVCTYKPDWIKLRATLLSIILQENIETEIILTDDGSENNFFSEAEKLFKEYDYQNYRLIANQQNIGTVKNIRGALEKTVGEYVYITSPGDFLFDESVLVDVYRFVKEKNAEVCFCDAVYYQNEQGIKPINNKLNFPPKPFAYDDDFSLEKQKRWFYWGNTVLGASIFRKREYAVRYFGEILDLCRYVEDNTTLALSVFDGVRIFRYPRFGIWYEQGTGVSTSKKNKWREILYKDIVNTYDLIRKRNTETVRDPFISFVCGFNSIPGIFRKVLYLLKKPAYFFEFLGFAPFNNRFVKVKGISTEWAEFLLGYRKER